MNDYAVKPKRHLLRTSFSVLVVALLMVPGVVAHEPVFGAGVGLRAAAVGTLIGITVGLVASWVRLPWWATAGVGVLAYFAGGGFAALPETAIGGVFPSAATWQYLVVQVVNVWKDLLTVIPPAHVFTGPAVLPYLSGVVAGLAATMLALRRRWLWASLPPLVFYAVGMAWSIPIQIAELPLALFFAVTMLAWWAVNAQWDRIERGESIVIGRKAHSAASEADSGSYGSMVSMTGTETGRRRRMAVVHWIPLTVSALVSVTVGIVIAALIVPSWGSGRPHYSLRDLVSPPLNVHDLPTPLEQYRHLNADLEDEEVLRVSGLEQGMRVRFAAMDTYDGVSWGIAAPETDNHGFYQVGHVVAPATSDVDEAARHSYDATVTLSREVARWIPTVGHLTEIDAPDEVAPHVFYDVELMTAISNVPVPGQASYRIAGWSEPVWSEGQLSGRAFVGRKMPDMSGVPEGLPELANEVVARAASPIDRARALERYFRETGFYANGVESPSRPGHNADRLSRLLGAEQMVGDDEQYASAMALAARALGMPARVVMGAYPEQYSDGEIRLLGRDVHAWVEIEFEGAGWVPFDPTPPRDQTPQTEVPKPKSVPKPQVLQPPEPPEEPPELPPASRDSSKGDPLSPPLRIPWMLIGGVGILSLVVLVPLLGIPLFKLWRRRRRRSKVGRSGVRNAWWETTDHALDSGVSLPVMATRLETAVVIDRALSSEGTVRALAQVVDAAEFSGLETTEAAVASAWEHEASARQAMRPDSWWERYRRSISWKALRARRDRRRQQKRELRREADEHQKRRMTRGRRGIKIERTKKERSWLRRRGR
ncbi:MAG: transglutaminase domain-containing protein [Actinomycetaceae bacterium]|nr:transglutaminase domain-containing protein [Actinomycetaceae bacterium]